ncbi:MAG: hypothetical protein V4585_05310 [Bacteroidota bacterium]
MQIEVAVTPVNLKFILSQNKAKLKVGRHSLYFLIYFAQRKYRDGNESTKTKIPTIKTKKKNSDNELVDECLHKLKYSKKLTFNCSMSHWLKLRMKGSETVIVVTSFNKIIRDFFYQDFFQFMNNRLLAKELLSLNLTEIKQFAIEYMAKLSLSDDDINLETLLRNYRRYRLNPNLDLYELIESLNDEY